MTNAKGALLQVCHPLNTSSIFRPLRQTYHERPTHLPAQPLPQAVQTGLRPHSPSPRFPRAEGIAAQESHSLGPSARLSQVQKQSRRRSSLSPMQNRKYQIAEKFHVARQARLELQRQLLRK